MFGVCDSRVTYKQQLSNINRKHLKMFSHNWFNCRRLVSNVRPICWWSRWPPTSPTASTAPDMRPTAKRLMHWALAANLLKDRPLSYMKIMSKKTNDLSLRPTHCSVVFQSGLCSFKSKRRRIPIVLSSFLAFKSCLRQPSTFRRWKRLSISPDWLSLCSEFMESKEYFSEQIS